ncbi:unnamed protein product [Strongylus vulgaris]|uniref:Uncharacterized protein n=1 Tax=Strongylus vulgaris TaxID=40348 RepID=A0A3P7IP67_STRVU|nr:unnamed protein product [Strongylus vulgaris]
MACSVLDASTSMLATVESEAMDVEQSTASKLREMTEVNRDLREELFATRRELDELRQLADSMNQDEKEAELEKLRSELIEATNRFLQIAAQKKALEELEDTLVSKDKLHGEMAAELERLRELGAYAEGTLKPLAHTISGTNKVEETQTNGIPPDVVPQSDEGSPKVRLTEKKVRRPSKPRGTKELKTVRDDRVHYDENRERRVFDQDVWEQQAMLMVSLYSELMQIMEEQEVKQKQMDEMEKVLFKGRRAMDDSKAQLHLAFEEIYQLKKNENESEDMEKEETSTELLELRRFASTIKMGGLEVEKRAEEVTRKLITEQIERVRLSRTNTVLRRRCNRAEQAMRRARERMVLIETQAGKRCAQLQYQLDTALIDLADCQNKLVRSVSIETYEKLAIRFKKECVSEVLSGEIDETWKENLVSIEAPVDAKIQELEAKNAYLKKIVEVISEQNDFWSKETEILQNENEELKRFVEDMENESDLKNILGMSLIDLMGSIEQRLLETIREQQEGRRDHERAYRKAREAEEKLALWRSEWSAQRSRLNARLNSLNGLSLTQIEQLRTKIQEVKESEMIAEDAKEKAETLRDELQQKVVVQKAGRKAKDTVEEENANILKIERKLQAVYGSLEMQTIKSERLEVTVKLREDQISSLKKELHAIEKENEELLTTIASANLWSKLSKDKDTNEGQDEPAIEESASTTIERPTFSPLTEERQPSEDSEATSTDSEGGATKTILQDNSKEFEKRLAKMKEAAELCIHGYKQQLRQKDQALEMYRKLAEEKLSTRSQPPEKEIVREEVRVVDERTEERLRQALGDVARLKEEIEELEKANRALYRKRRRSIVPVVSTVECQTDIFTKEENETKDIEQKTKSPSRVSPADSVSSNMELILACEKIREDAMAELESRAPKLKEVYDFRVELEKTKKENRRLRNMVEDQRKSMESFKKDVINKKSGEDEVARWNERKKLEEMLNTVRKKLADSLEREKGVRDKLIKRDRLVEDLRRDEEMRRKELERTRKKFADLQYERDMALKENEENHKLQKKLIEERKKLTEEAAKLEQNEKVDSSTIEKR